MGLRVTSGPSIPSRCEERLLASCKQNNLPMPSMYLLCQVVMLGGEADVVTDDLAVQGGMRAALERRGMLVEKGPDSNRLVATTAGIQVANEVLRRRRRKMRPGSWRREGRRVNKSSAVLEAEQAPDLLPGLLLAADWLRSDQAKRRIRGLGRSRDREAFMLELLADSIDPSKRR